MYVWSLPRRGWSRKLSLSSRLIASAVTASVSTFPLWELISWLNEIRCYKTKNYCKQICYKIIMWCDLPSLFVLWLRKEFSSILHLKLSFKRLCSLKWSNMIIFIYPIYISSLMIFNIWCINPGLLRRLQTHNYAIRSSLNYMYIIQSRKCKDIQLQFSKGLI